MQTGGTGAGTGGQGTTPPAGGGHGPVIQTPGTTTGQGDAGHGGTNPPVINVPHSPAPQVETPTHPAPADHGPVVTPQQHQPIEQPTHHEPQSPSVFGHEPPAAHTPPAHTDVPGTHGAADHHGF
ncbi:hypothetical protein A5661_27240 [Mycobacterium asiaticum]|uniref:Uncharacterized protein n=1 Tax=Mycobacterium asiaticum TaxID=1790 RepID=A0A1A3CZ85_MYCAS|nr:hypothetical protein A5661_27240 [Mycobacterium asiaticum]OBJ54848.1 hypothetical protein A9W94_20805 [Mycobacterium asiaticum]OBJ87943.1 hypothetical protein A5640_00570 [Mycobacterium asiaticum]